MWNTHHEYQPSHIPTLTPPSFFLKLQFFAIIQLQGELYEANEVPKYTSFRRNPRNEVERQMSWAGGGIGRRERLKISWV